MGNMGELTSSTQCQLFTFLLSRILRSIKGNPFRSVNITEGEPCERAMTTGHHTVRDIYCCKCGSTLGWKYVSVYLLCYRPNLELPYSTLAYLIFRTRPMNSHRNTKRASLSSSADFWSTSSEDGILPFPLPFCLDPTTRSFPTHLDTSNRFMLSLLSTPHSVHDAICTIQTIG